jgi:superfamily I DNA/RNA helicase
MWSIGVVMLEILVGTPIIVSNSEYRQIRNVLAQSQEFLDAKTSRVLCWLLFKEGTEDLEAYLHQTLEAEPNLIGEAVRGLEAACVDIKTLSDLDRAGKRYMLAEKAELQRQFKIETD